MTDTNTFQKQNKFSLIPYLLRYKWHYVMGIIVLLLVDLASLYIPQFTGELVDGLTDGTLTDVKIDWMKIVENAFDALAK